MKQRAKQKQLYLKTQGYNFYNRLNYHLKKVEPLKNKYKRVLQDRTGGYVRNQKISVIPQKKNVQKKPTVIPDDFDQINEEHNNQNIAKVASQMKLYQTSESGRRNIFERKGSEQKNKKIQIANRGKSLKYWNSSRQQNRIINQIKTFFNNFLSDSNGCRCGTYCECKQVLLKWIGVSFQLINKNYERLLKIVNRTETQQTDNFNETQEDYQFEQTKKYKKQRIQHHIQIQKDVVRTQTQCEIFNQKDIQQKMERILMCYAAEDPQVGYIQSMNIVLSGVIYHVRDQAQAYAIVRKIFFQIREIYLNDFKQCDKHISYVVNQFKMLIKDLYEHLQQIGIEISIIIFPWVLSLLCVLIPLEFLHIVYIGFVNQGWKFIYKTIISLFVYYKEQLLKMDESGDILVFLSVSNQEKDSIDWQDIIKFGDTLKFIN